MNRKRSNFAEQLILEDMRLQSQIDKRFVLREELLSAFLLDIKGMYQLADADMNVLRACMLHCDPEGVFVTIGSYRERLIQVSGHNTGVFNNSLQHLQDCGLLEKLQRGNYKLNMNVVRPYSELQSVDEIEYKVVYELKGKEASL